MTISLLSPPQHIHEIISKVKRAHVSIGEQLPGHWGNSALDTWYHTPFVLSFGINYLTGLKLMNKSVFQSFRVLL